MRLGGAWYGSTVLLASLAVGCVVPAAQLRGAGDGDFFPLVPRSRWEYVVRRSGGDEKFPFVATVRADDFRTADGHACPVVDEQYGADPHRFPVVYCTEDGFLHRVMSLEYRGETLADNGLRSGELKFLPRNLRRVAAWDGVTNAYRMPDGSGFEIQQRHRVVPVPERVVVPAGDFPRCVRVETTAIHSAVDANGALTGPRVIFYYSDWYAPDVGLVKTEQRDGDSHVVTTIELVRYAVGTRS